MVYGRYLDEFEKGQVYEHSVSKTITESDNNLFCLLTMNHHPVHLDETYASNQKHGKILVVGTYVLSLVVGLTVSDISGKAIANLGYEFVAHKAPVFIGDTIHVETRVLDKWDSKSKKDRGILYVETDAYNQVDTLVLTLRRHILIPKEGD